MNPDASGLRFAVVIGMLSLALSRSGLAQVAPSPPGSDVFALIVVSSIPSPALASLDQTNASDADSMVATTSATNAGCAASAKKLVETTTNANCQKIGRAC